ncbi:unnamed protein product [Schistosoma rodhaini]|uniref:Uncharacterized protein n=1 Tax=Schistosoma rodhaini TaxID=6188 RepID=A0AA85F2H0_9TREM|nr:unnamed protein product [Schistosoma rodhaini]
MRLRSSIRRASKTFTCLQESNNVKLKPCVTSGNVPRKIKRNICEPNPIIPKNPPSVRKNVSASRRVNKGKQTSVIPEDPYLFIDNDSDDYKENVIPNSSKDVTKKCAKKTHSEVKVANLKKSKSKQWTASTAFTKQYIPSGKPNDARYEDALHANTPGSIVTAVPLVSKTVNPKSASTFPESNQLISPGGLTTSCSFAKTASTYAESKTVSFNFPEKVCNSCQVTSSVSNTPEFRRRVSIHNLEESIPRYSKTTLTSLNPQIASTPAISNANTELLTSVGCHALVPTPINYTSIKRNENSHDDSSQILESHVPNNSSSSSNPHSGATNNERSSQDLSKGSTSSSDRRRKQASESERQKAYDSWLAEFNNELQKYESFELSVENQALPTDDH